MSGLRNRSIKVTLSLPGGDVTLDETSNIKIRIHKNPLFIQNKAQIEVSNLPQIIRQQLLSNFTAWQKNQRDRFGLVAPYVDVQIAAGYVSTDGSDSTSVIYKGQVVQVDLVSGPPNITVRISCYTHQVDRTKFISEPLPYQSTFKELVLFSGNVMGFDSAHVKCNTRYDNNIVYNAARSMVTAAALLPYLQTYYPTVAAFIDDDFLIVKNLDEAINESDFVTLNEFIGVPNWTEWGVEGTVYLDPAIRVAGAAKFESILNPSLNGQFVISELEYELTSRDTPFYVKVTGTPPATTVTTDAPVAP